MLGGVVLACVLVLPLTPVPWDWLRSMAQPAQNDPEEPAFLVMMGGGGIPSESGLTRSYKTAEAARAFPFANVIIAMPMEPDEQLPGLIERELIMRGVDAARLQREPRGRNTREQALEVFNMVGDASGAIGLITSPEHMTRVWRSFAKAGFTRLSAYPSWSEDIKADMNYDERELGAPSLGGVVGANSVIKYKYWDNLLILVKCTRESVALLYYKVMGWI